MAAMRKVQAERMAERIKRYWETRGCVVDAWAVAEMSKDIGDKGVSYTVRSNMSGGWPRGRRPRQLLRASAMPGKMIDFITGPGALTRLKGLKDGTRRFLAVTLSR
jgi:hypothetical protein